MGYDLHFLLKSPSQSWPDALAASRDGSTDGGALDPAVWSRLVESVRAILAGDEDDFEVYTSDEDCELTHEPTGIRIDYFPNSAALSVPYWYSGDPARTVAATMYALGTVVESETGLLGFDVQLDLPLADAAADPRQAATFFDRVAASSSGRGATR